MIITTKHMVNANGNSHTRVRVGSRTTAKIPFDGSFSPIDEQQKAALATYCKLTKLDTGRRAVIEYSAALPDSNDDDHIFDISER